jgi:hypothetical protein
MTREQGQLVGKNLAKHKGEWVVLDKGKLVSHAPKFKDAVAGVPANVQKPAIYYSSKSNSEMIVTSF